MIKKILLIFVILLSFSLISASYYYNFEIKYDNGNLKINSVNVEFSQEKDFANNYYNEDNSYYINIVDDKNAVLDKVNFSVPNFVLYDLVDEKGEFNESKIVFLDEAEFNILSNYYENGYKAILYDSSGKELNNILLSQFSKEAFNIEDFRENKIEKSDLEDKEKIIDRASQENYTKYVKILIIALVILIIVLIVSLKKKI